MLLLDHPNVQADLSLCWVFISEGMLSHTAAQMITITPVRTQLKATAADVGSTKTMMYSKCPKILNTLFNTE